MLGTIELGRRSDTPETSDRDGLLRVQEPPETSTAPGRPFSTTKDASTEAGEVGVPTLSTITRSVDQLSWGQGVSSPRSPSWSSRDIIALLPTEFQVAPAVPSPAYSHCS